MKKLILCTLAFSFGIINIAISFEPVVTPKKLIKPYKTEWKNPEIKKMQEEILKITQERLELYKNKAIPVIGKDAEIKNLEAQRADLNLKIKDLRDKITARENAIIAEINPELGKMIQERKEKHDKLYEEFNKRIEDARKEGISLKVNPPENTPEIKELDKKIKTLLNDTKLMNRIDKAQENDQIFNDLMKQKNEFFKQTLELDKKIRERKDIISNQTEPKIAELNKQKKELEQKSKELMKQEMPETKQPTKAIYD